MRPPTTITIDPQVMVVLAAVVPVVDLHLEVMVVKEVRGRQDKVSMVRDQGLHGTPLVAGVPVRRGTVETVRVVLILNHTVVMVNSQQ